MATLTRILSIDGGGIRGIIPARVLMALEAKLQSRSGNPNTRIADHFDLIAGTSTGGILTCVYLTPTAHGSGQPRFTAADALRLYREHGAEIFSIPIRHRITSAGGTLDEKYPATGLERVLNRYLGDVKLGELLGPCLVTAYDIERRRTWFFRQHRAHEPGRDFFVRDVARATSAAPTYFEAARVRAVSGVEYALVDGGVFANNPALCAYAEARTMPGNPTAKQMAILSVGTGEIQKPYLHANAKDWGLAGWLRPVLDIMMSGVAETVDYQLRQMYDAVGASNQYVRIQCDLIHEDAAEMDNAEPANLERLVRFGTETAERFDAELDAFVDLLLA